MVYCVERFFHYVCLLLDGSGVVSKLFQDGLDEFVSQGVEVFI
jgi:hypothetical protein